MELLVHEMSLIEGISKLVTEKALDNGIKSITKIKLVVGKLTNAFPDALEAAFIVLRNEERLYTSNAQLEIEQVTTRGRCNDCFLKFEIVDNYNFICPNCSSFNVAIVSGRELYVDYFEGE